MRTTIFYGFGALIVAVTFAAVLQDTDSGARADLRVDANRDGVVDQRDERAVGPAIILVNCDDDDGDHIPDNWPGAVWQASEEKLGPPDSRVNGLEDLEDVGRIQIRKRGLGPDERMVVRVEKPADEHEYFSTIEAHHRLRILLAGPDGREIVGPSAGPEAELSRELVVGDGWAELGIEGIEFGAPVNVRLARLRGQEVVSEDRVMVRCSSFIVLSNAERVEATIVAIEDHGETGDNREFVEAFDREDGVDTRILDLMLPIEDAYDDVWVQDQWEIGWTSAPGSRGIRVLLELPRNGRLKWAGRRELIGPGTGCHEKFLHVAAEHAEASESLNFGGNWEASGPLRGFPAGRILVGDNLSGGFQKPLHRELLEFFRAQGIQKPIVIDTGWLTVGHVDQVIGVLPGRDGRCRYVIASPRSAIAALENVSKGARSARILEGKTGWEMSVGGFLSNDRDLRRFNESLQTELDAIAAQVERELGIRMIEIPALFRPVDKGGAAPWFPALQNAQVVNGRVLVAEPFGPRVGGVDLFQAAYEKAISETGLMVAWVPGCFALHTRKGAVHCASNRLARPSPGLESW